MKPEHIAVGLERNHQSGGQFFARQLLIIILDYTGDHP
jgi:hypothetical protein